jgi:hypothetical protein
MLRIRPSSIGLKSDIRRPAYGVCDAGVGTGLLVATPLSALQPGVWVGVRSIWILERAWSSGGHHMHWCSASASTLLAQPCWLTKILEFKRILGIRIRTGVRRPVSWLG